jgi:iron complex outermembrane receptor protein
MSRTGFLARRLLAGTIALGGPMMSGAAQAADEQAAAASDSAPSPGIQEIIVTAQKREQSLQTVPISITALSADKIAANRIVDVRDLSAVAPNLTVRLQGGGAGNASFSMRGLVSSGFTAGQDKGVSLYVDGVYLQASSGGVFELSDVERIEVLKGPQGTLFGRNATGGAISITTRQPTGKFGIQQTFTYGNFDTFRSKTRVDLPEWKNLSASISYVHSQRRGDTRNLGAGTRWDYGPATAGHEGVRVSPNFLGDENVDAVAAAVKYQPTDNFRLTYHYDYSRNDYTSGAITPVATDFGILNFASPGFGDLVAALIAGQDPAKMSPITNVRPAAVNNAFTTPGFTTHSGHSLTAKWQVTPAISLTDILAFRKMKVRLSNNLSGFGGLINNQPFLGTVGDPYILLENAPNISSKQWSNEFQFNWNTHLFNLTAGYLHFDDKSLTGGIQGAPILFQFTTAPGYVVPGNGSELATDVHSKSDAWFAQPEIHLTDRLDIVAGVRVTKDDKRGGDNTLLGVPTFPIAYDKTTWSYLAGVNYRPASNILLYGKYATGFITGGFLATRAFNPETAKSWEAGVKADLLNRRLRANLALFTVKYGDLQISTCGACSGVPAASQVIINGGDARAKGFELETTAALTDNLTVEANVGFTDFHFLSLNPIAGDIATYLPENRPKWTANWSIQYQTRPLIDNASLSFRIDANFRSEVNLIGSPPTAAIRDLTTVPDQVIVNGRLALRDLEFGRLKGQIALWGKNLFDNRQLNNVLSLSLVYAGTFERARQFGVDLTFEL